MILIDKFNLVDIWRMLNPDLKRYTWRQGKSAKNLKQSRLDYWLVSAHMVYDLESVDISHSTRSDHSLISLNFYKNKSPARGPSFWHFNANLLKDQNYVEFINDKLNMAIEKYIELDDKGLKWDLIKMEVRSSTLCFSKKKAKENRDNIKDLMIKVEALEKQLSKEPNDDTLQKYNEGKAYIENYNNEKANGVIIRAKADWAEFGEKSTRFFLNLEKRNYNIKCITKLIKEDGSEVKNADDILKYEEVFYKDLYTDPINVSKEARINASTSFLDETCPKITEADKARCENPITLEEIGQALKNLKNGKFTHSNSLTQIIINRLVFVSICIFGQK
jgi:hypothetical protein